jgi:Flp pilus assembly pilin Flp
VTTEARRRLLSVAPALLSIVGAVYLVLIAVDSRPIADDWTALAATRHAGLWGYVHGNWLTGSGRYSAMIVLWLTIKIFGDASVNVTAVVMLCLLWAFIGLAIRHSGGHLDSGATRSECGLLALLITVAITASAPSLFDSIGWLSGMLVDFAGVVAAAGTVALWVWFARLSTAPRWSVAAMFAAGWIAAGFEELVGTVLVIAAALAILNVSDARHDSGRRISLAGLAATGFGAATGVALNVLSPASRRRASLHHAHISLSAALGTSGHNLSFIYDDIHDGVLLLAVASGVLAWVLFGAIRKPRARGWCLAWAGFLAVVPWLVTSALTAWGGATESGDRSPFRAAFLITGPISVAVALLVLVVLSRFPRLLDRNRATAIGLALAAAGTVGLAHKAAPIIRAERLRAQAVSQRGASVRRQLAADDGTIRLTPAPLLTVYTQALDLSFGPTDQQRDWIAQALRGYYRIPVTDRLQIVARQPRDYCVPHVAASWVGVRSCQELGASS